ncbi:MAG: hypothetical protein AAGI14_04065 [Pseudomonadota bacterium]
MSAPSYFQQAVGLHKAGRLRQAIEVYRAHLKRGPDAHTESVAGAPAALFVIGGSMACL